MLAKESDLETNSLKKNLFISFSGGETSAYMTYLILNSNIRSRYDDVVVLFANTGQENEETLEFVERCDKEFGFNVVWVESIIHMNARKSPTAKVVSYSSASRNGEPFEDMISKYGIPNRKFPSCTRDLKLRPMEDYLKGLGWKKGSYDIAIGIRIDAIDRMSSNKSANNIVYPLIEDVPTTKIDVNTWWARQKFRLNLKGYQGNCKWCWKKSFRKHYTLAKETPDIYEFPMRMEKTYGLIGPEFKKEYIEDYRRTFFRGNKSTEDVLAAASSLGDDFIPASDDSIIFNPDLDVGAGCEESCEVFSDGDLQNE